MRSNETDGMTASREGPLREQDRLPEPGAGERLERLAHLLPVMIRPRVPASFKTGSPRAVLEHVNEPIGIRSGQRTKDHRSEDAEDMDEASSSTSSRGVKTPALGMKRLRGSSSGMPKNPE
jgi:hypothetical protein